MSIASKLSQELCHAFCDSIVVRSVPIGLAVSTAFSDRSGDRLGFYVVETSDGYYIEDDGDYLSELIGLGIPVDQGTRGNLLSSILDDAKAYWDHDTYEIRTEEFKATELRERLISFISALIRVRDLELITRETAKSTFREDVIAAMQEEFGQIAEIEENTATSKTLTEFPADIVIRPTGHAGHKGAVYLVNTSDKLNEALLLLMEAEKIGERDLRVMALIEEPEMRQLSRRKFQRAQNRSLPMPIFRGDEGAAIQMIMRELNLH